MRLKTANYYKKLFVRSLTNDKVYHAIKLYKIIFDYLLGKDEDQIYSFLPLIVPSNSVILDIGANMGQYACRLAKQFPNSAIFSIEPFSVNYEALVKMIKILKLKNVTPINTAISANESIDQLAVPILNGKLMVGTQAHLNIDIGNTKFENVNYKYFKISSNTLDKLVKDYSLERIDFIKVDTEGYDSIVLSSGKEIITKFKPIMRIEEDCLNGKFDSYFELGYRVFYLTNNNKLIFDKSTKEKIGDNFLIHNSYLERIQHLLLKD